MIPAVFLFILGVIAFSEACHHFKDIERHRPINHGYALAFRLAIGSVMFAVMSVTHWLLAEDYRFMLMAPMGWAWWTSIFRFTLNNLRGLDWRYLGFASSYDWFWIALTWPGWSFKKSWDKNERKAARLIWSANYSLSLKYAQSTWSTNVHRAGLYAYTFEALVFAASIAAYFLLR